MTPSPLTGVPETALWTLRNRALEAARPDSAFADPEAVALFESLDATAGDLDRFGRPSQAHPLRALAVDDAIRDFLTVRPGRPVVALGEGLQTTFWRLGQPEVPWFSIDLPEMTAAQERILPTEPGITRIGVSALDRAWFEAVPPGPAIVVAEGLFMYLPTDEVHALVADLAERFPGGRLLYDSIPRWFSALTLKGRVRLTPDYVAPPMPHSQRVGDAARLVGSIRGVASVTDVQLPRGRGPWGSGAMRRLSGAPVLRNLRPSLTLVTFDAAEPR